MKSLLTDWKIQKFVLIWIAFWFAVMSFVVFIFDPKYPSYLSNITWATGYFLLMTLLGQFIMRKSGEMYAIKQRNLQLPFTFLSGLVFCLASIGVKSSLPVNPQTNEYFLNLGFYYCMLQWDTILAKIADIFWQQTMIIGLVLFLKKNCRRPREVVEAFTVVFFVIHIPLLWYFGLMGLIFIIPSFFAGAIFSYLITFYSWGVLGSMLVHQYFYIATAVILRLLSYTWYKNI